GVQDLYGLAFHLSYPVAALRFTGATEGSVLNAGGTVPTAFQIADSPPGNLVVGLTRLGPVSGTAASGTLMTLQLTAAATGSGNLAFSNNVATDSQGNVISGVTWAGGSVQVTLLPGARR
ncbi:MAG TPA: cohesin domain-containing protein, partial [Thermoanaerobaculia bacterium]